MFFNPQFAIRNPQFRRGAVAQLGERLVCNQEVVGSNPIGSTRKIFDFRFSIFDLKENRNACGMVAVAVKSKI